MHIYIYMMELIELSVQLEASSSALRPTLHVLYPFHAERGIPRMSKVALEISADRCCVAELPRILGMMMDTLGTGDFPSPKTIKDPVKPGPFRGRADPKKRTSGLVPTGSLRHGPDGIATRLIPKNPGAMHGSGSKPGAPNKGRLTSQVLESDLGGLSQGSMTHGATWQALFSLENR